jgi:hypothetical protein
MKLVKLHVRITLQSPLQPDHIYQRLKEVTQTSGLFRRRKTEFSGTVAWDHFELIPKSGGLYLPVYRGTIASDKSGGSKITVDRSLHNERALPIILLLVALLAVVVSGIGALIILPLVLGVYLPVHYAAHRDLSNRTERKLCDILQVTAVSGESSLSTRGYQVCDNCGNEYPYFRDRCTNCEHSVYARRDRRSVMILSALLAIMVAYLAYMYLF